MAELIGGLGDVNTEIKPMWTGSEHSQTITDLAVRSGSMFYFLFCFSLQLVYLISSGGDKTIRIWDLFGHRLLSTIATPSIISSVRKPTLS